MDEHFNLILLWVRRGDDHVLHEEVCIGALEGAAPRRFALPFWEGGVGVGFVSFCVSSEILSWFAASRDAIPRRHGTYGKDLKR